MIYIFSALYQELENLIKEYSLEAVNDSILRIWANDTITAVVTGVGKVNAGFAVGRVFALFPPDETSVLINTGVAAGGMESGTFIINAISDMDTGLKFYPDMIMNWGIPEIGIRTVSQIVNSADTVTEYLYDMESSAIYQSAVRFLSPDRMFFIKTVSDSGTDSEHKISGQIISELMKAQIPVIEAIIREYSHVPSAAEDNRLFDEFSDRLYCSEYMRSELKGLMAFASSLGDDVEAVLNDIISQRGEVMSRKSGREVLDEFKRRITS